MSLYGSSTLLSRSNSIRALLGFGPGTILFIYLSVPLFFGKPKKIHLPSIADRIKSKRASWKGSLLSIMGRVELVKSVIQGTLLYSFQVYAWPVSLIKSLDKWICCFNWSSDIATRKLVTVAWNKVAAAFAEGGLGIRPLRLLNHVAMLKLAWQLVTAESSWALLIRARFFRGNHRVAFHVSSSIWYSLCPFLDVITDNSQWQIGW